MTSGSLLQYEIIRTLPPIQLTQAKLVVTVEEVFWIETHIVRVGPGACDESVEHDEQALERVDPLQHTVGHDRGILDVRQRWTWRAVTPGSYGIHLLVRADTLHKRAYLPIEVQEVRS